jgi:hypothetical protein
VLVGRVWGVGEVPVSDPPKQVKREVGEWPCATIPALPPQR